MRYKHTHLSRLARVCLLFLLGIGVFGLQGVLAQDAEPGTVQNKEKAFPTSKALSDIFATESGLISVSIDGIGSNDATNGAEVQVEKPSAGATVRSAFLLTAPTPNDVLSDLTISNGSNSLNIGRTDYDAVATGADNQENGRIDITSFIKPIVDAASTGLIDFTIVESSTFATDGQVLVVIFDDPSVTEPRSVSLIFGAQDQSGDSFSIGLADPFDDASQDILMSLGISFGFQGFTGTGQVSLVDVNGNRLTSAAGGQDDCDIFEDGVNQCAQNGALLTVGGIGDDPANPTDPLATDSDGARSDDEFYTLDDFISDGDNTILVETENPSFDDNVFFAAFIIQGTAAVVGEGITLGPTSAVNPLNTDHTVTATVQDDTGGPIQGRAVDFEITSGPNAGLMATATTDASGQATFTWSSSVEGTDVIIAETVDSNGGPLVSNEARKTWEQGSEPGFTADELCTVTNGFGAKYEYDDVSGQFVYENDPLASTAPDLVTNTITDTNVDGEPVGISFQVDPSSNYVVAQAWVKAASGDNSLEETIFNPAAANGALTSPNGKAISFKIECLIEAPVCPKTTLDTEVVDDETLLLTLTNDDGLLDILFRDESDNPKLENLVVDLSALPSGIIASNNTGLDFEFDGAGDPPTSVTFTLIRQDLTKAASFMVQTANQCGRVSFDPPVFTDRLRSAGVDLQPNYPNPFTDNTTIAFSLGEAGKVKIHVYNVLGQRVATLLDGQLPAGAHSVRWNGQSSSGQWVSSGVYFVRMEANGRTFTQRMSIIR